MTKKQRGRVVVASGILLALALLFHLINIAFIKDSLLIISTFVAGIPIAKKAWNSVRMRAFSIELLVTIAVTGALIIGEYVEGAVVTFLFLFGAYLEIRTLEKTRSSLKALVDMAPMEAQVIRAGEKVTVPAEDIEIGEQVIIRSGEKVAVDGRVISGSAFINEAAITGESVPARKATGDRVFSGSIIDHGYVEVEAEKVGDDTTFSKIIELVEEAQESKAKTQKFLERFAAFYTPSILVLSVIVFIFTRDIHLTLTFLVIACPGALVISAPVSIVAGIGNGAKRGVLIKGGEIMEKLAGVDVVVFDKTGTITKGKPEVTGVKSYGISEDELLLFAAEAEVISEHHLGQTIVREAEVRGLKLVNKPVDTEVVKGKGIKVTLYKQSLAIGNRSWVEANEVSIPTDVEVYAAAQEKKGNTAVLVASVDARSVLGVISIADQIRVGAKETIAHLKGTGIKKVVMLTGDHRYTAAVVSNQLGLDHVYSELLPEDKVDKIRELMSAGYKVAMIGDGINDAPAIATADVGIAMGGAGTDVTLETADVVLMADKLERLGHTFSLAKATVRNMKQNMFFAVAVVLLLLAGVLTSHIYLASGMLIHELSVLLVIVNAIRLVRYTSDKRSRRRRVERRPNLAVKEG